MSPPIPPDYSDPRHLRHVELLGSGGYTLWIWDTFRRDEERGRSDRTFLGYAFYAPGKSEPLFLGEDLSPSARTVYDSDECLIQVLGWLTLRPEDTDAEFFEAYTPAQLTFAEDKAEELQMWSLEVEPGEEPWVPLACFHRYAYDLVFPKGVTGRGLIGVGGGKRGRL